mmetsp:Transcript_27498/g.40621  ORF Transcript_27498/g.40621 Transcript_27498/m.40621 type:complete len:374 (+) Transcript_27498:274-1395(+)|eukprot:CAMPEP_0194244806 /NCGR_PEP_ID=MMETSP0158-20130606/12045_1 /TAXON_ID=33649 /ORGANISM="Thalassionema nitzschioides, Strain L26-B" /LENGTH=373 /DNA_ID=CAMNT_0038980393 /DNA_START=143 /DNA_END=1264 /DNA_ORIENTATION=-
MFTAVGGAAQAQAQQQAGQQVNQKHDIFVGNLAFNTTEEQLHQVFSEVGRLIKVRMVTDAETGKPRGFAFVEFEDPQAALSAIRNMNDYELNGRRIRVNFSNSSHLEALAGKLGMDLPNTHTAGGANSNNNTGGGVGSSSGTTTGAGGGTTHQKGGAGVYGTVAVADALKGMSKGELYDVVAKLKEISERDPDEARRILSGHPQLPEAMLFCLSKLDMVQTPVVPAAAMGVVPQMMTMPPPPPPMGVVDPRLAAAAARPADPRAAAAAGPPPAVADPRARVAVDPRQKARQDPRAATPAATTTDPRARAPPPTTTNIPPPPPPRLDSAPPQPPRIDPALAQQVMSLTPEMIAQLPPENRQSIMTLRNQITGGR